MLSLQSISKVYGSGANQVTALHQINLAFRASEFVAILGASGSGKTTMLNLIGGLDRYTAGDLLIDGISTKEFKDADWDAYRNSTVGFVFQTYNLIPHLSVLENVEIALTLSGVGRAERKARATKALESVGLFDQLRKRPNQLSGGQMQRVAIARALVNDPKIVLADEPTGALDSKTSETIMDLLTEIAKDRLVIMVTHNQDIAAKYANRIVEVKDGQIIADSHPHTTETAARGKRLGRKSSMSFFTAMHLSFNNLLTKKTRTLITSIAGSIGIIGVAMVLAISGGTQAYIGTMQSDTLSGFPISILPSTSLDRNFSDNYQQYLQNQYTYPTEDVLYPYDRLLDSALHINTIDADYLTYLEAMNPEWYSDIAYNFGVTANMIVQTDLLEYKRVNTGSISWQQLPPSADFVGDQYDLLTGDFPSNNHQLVLVVDQNNRINVNLLDALGITYTHGTALHFDDLVGRTMKLMYNNDYYRYNSETERYGARGDYETMYALSTAQTMEIVGVIRVKPGSSSTLLSRGVAYRSELTEELVTNGIASDVVQAQLADDEKSVLTGLTFTSGQFDATIRSLGGNTIPASIQIYPSSFEGKDQIKTYLDAYNEGKEVEDQVYYTDLSETIISTVSSLIDTISLVLSAFAAISLIVSSVMIGIITYVSVVERTKEIGVLRSIGARKKDIARVFIAETVLIGLFAGVIGIVVTYLLSIPINAIAFNAIGVEQIAQLALYVAGALIALSMALTWIASLIPSRIAANKDPVVALRTE